MNDERNPNRETINQSSPASPDNPILNPETIQRVVSLLAASGIPGDTAESSESTSQNQATVTGGEPVDAFSALLSDPTILQRLPQMISLIKPLLNVPPSSPDSHEAMPTAARASKSDTHRDQLLLSLKPFLSPSRCEAIDTILRIARLGEVFGPLK